MNFDQIKTFISIEKTRSFSKTARELYISQPTASNHIKALEDEMKTQLIIREPGELSLTKQGVVFYNYALKMMNMRRELNRNLNQRGEEQRYGLLDIQAPHLQTDRQLGSFFVRMIEEKVPSVICRIVEREDDEIAENVLNDKTDLGICSKKLDSSGLVYEEAFVEEIVLVTPNRKKYRNLSPAEVRELLLTEGHIRYDFGNGSDFLWNDFFGKTLGLNLHNIKTVGRCSNYNILLEAIEKGKGIGFISSTIVKAEADAGKVLTYRCRELLQKPFYVVYKQKRADASRVLTDVKNLLVEELGKSVCCPEISF